MKLAIFAAALLVAGAVFSAPASEKKPIFISVTNGGPFGSWGTIGVCPEGSKAVGFSLKVQQHQIVGDNTAVNGIRLHCYDSALRNETIAESVNQQWGEWGTRANCLGSSFLTAFSLRVLEDQGSDGDDSAANDVQFKCSSGEILSGTGLGYGTWGNWSSECPIGICGLQSKVESDQGILDDSALNDVQLFCC